jgi:hypothetical protein
MRMRQIGRWGTASRIVVGVALLVWAALARPTPADVLIGLLMFPSAVLVVLAVRGRGAQPLRAVGQPAHVLNCAIAIGLFTWQPVAASLFYGGSMVLAASRGMGACEIFAVSNYLRKRDDRLGCPLFLPVDAAEHAITARRRAADRDRSTWS